MTSRQLAYLARYTHLVAISNLCVISADETGASGRRIVGISDCVARPRARREKP